MITRRLLFLLFIINILPVVAQEYRYPYTFFTNATMPGTWFFSKTDSSGGSVIFNEKGKLPVNGEVFHTSGNSLELKVRNTVGGKWEASVLRSEKRGVDFFIESSLLSFWLYFETGTPSQSTGTPSQSNETPSQSTGTPSQSNETPSRSYETPSQSNETPSRYDLPQISLITSDNQLTTHVEISIGKSNVWQKIEIPLESFGIHASSSIENIIGIVFSQNEKATRGDLRFFIDDIELVGDIDPQPVSQLPVITSAEGFDRHVDIAWESVTDPNVRLIKIYRSENHGEYTEAGIQQPYVSRYADYTGVPGKDYSYRISFLNQNYEESELSLPVEAATRAMSDDELLSMVQEACFRYYWEGAEPVSGLARENIPGRHNMVATGASGFGIMALIVGTERNFITRRESVDRFIKILDFLEKADRFHGVYGHFMDGPTGKVEPFFGSRDNGADLVETAFLLQGLLAARQYFDREDEKERMIREQITRIWEEAEFDWFRKDPDSKYLYWHWSPDQQWVINHPLIGWNETMIVYLLAISSPTHAIPAEMYYSGWAGQDKRAKDYRTNWGGSEQGMMYANGDSYFGIRLDVGVNNGGPLFFTHYSYMGFDPHFLTDKYTNYFENNRSIAKINYSYCVANPNHFKGYGEEGWGLTASDGPYDYSADEPIPSRDFGKLAPTGAISSFPYTPEESMKALKNYYFNCGHFLWGEYGFKDAFNLTENWCSEIYMGLNQAPMVVMIENYRTGLIWKLFMQNEEITEGIRRIEALQE